MDDTSFASRSGRNVSALLKVRAGSRFRENAPPRRSHRGITHLFTNKVRPVVLSALTCSVKVEALACGIQFFPSRGRNSP